MSGEYADELAAIGQALTDEADILVYGCNFGEGGQGQEAATKLAANTGADVAASDDATGSAALGGDWDLEFRAGSVETTAVLSFEAQANFMGLLAPPGNVRDEFSPFAYNGNDGSDFWSTDWQEVSDDGDSASGNVFASGGVLNLHLLALLGNSPRGAWREADLSQAANATLSFDYQLSTGGLLGATTIDVQVSDNGGPWFTLFTTGGSTSWQTQSVAIPSAYVTANTQIRLLASSGGLLVVGDVQFDNVEIRYDADPVITGGATASVTVAENTTAVTTVTATDADLPVQSLTYSLIGGADPGLFSIDPSTGALSFNTAPNFEAPADVGINNVYDVTVQVSDGNGGTDTQAISVTITNVNEAPVVNDQAFSVSENTANGTPVGTVIASDVDAGDTRTFSITAGNTGGAFAIDNAGVITVANTAALDFETNPTFTLTVQIQDAGGLNDTATVTVTLTNVNEPPVNTVPGAQTVAEDTPLALGGISVNDADGNLSTVALAVGNGTLTVTVQGGALISAGANGSAALTLSGSQADINATLATLTYQGSPNYNGADALTVTSTDTNSASDTVTITVTAVSDAPVANADAYGVAEDGTLNIAAAGVLINDTDVEGNPLTAVLVAGSANGALTLNADGSFSDTPNANFFGTDSFTYRANDGTVDSALAATVTPVNDAPVITSNGGGASASVSIAENTTAVTTVAATDADVPAQTLTYSIIGGADQRLFSINSSTGALTFNTAPDFEAPADANADNVYEVTVQASDGSLTDTQALSVTVIAAAPAAPAPPGTGGGTPEGSPSAPGSGPSSGDARGSEVDDGSSSKTSPVRKTAASDNSPVTVSASRAQPAVSRVDVRSKQGFSNDTSQNLGSKQPVAKQTNAAAASAVHVQDAKDPYSTLKANRFLEELNRLRGDMNHQLSLETLALSIGLSVGYAIWLVRGGALLSSLLSSLPAWRWLDPLPVLAHLRDPRDDEEGNEDSLQAVLKTAEARDQSKPIPDVEVVPPAQQAATGAVLSQPDATVSIQQKADTNV